ncbi:MAG: hypothetical protein M3R70_03510 [Actinomycetota bacterium]|nr:hypothetical protein [Actinomycetota bacterium]
MARGFALLTLVASLVISGLLFSGQWSGLMGKTGPNGQPQPVEQAYRASADASAAAAERQLEAYRAQYDTYFGAPMDAPTVTVLRADATSYCFRVDVGGRQLYEAGPGGGLVTQACA